MGTIRRHCDKGLKICKLKSIKKYSARKYVVGVMDGNSEYRNQKGMEGDEKVSLFGTVMEWNDLYQPFSIIF